MTREETDELLSGFAAENCSLDNQIDVCISAGPGKFAAVIGHKAENKKYFAQKYPGLSIVYREDPSLEDGSIIIQ